jgi:ABC-type phosphate transport system substrate-binding protein
MRKSIALGTFAALAAGSAAAGALDSVPSMRGSDTLKNITTAILDQCTALGTFTTDNAPTKPGIQPIVYDGTGSSNGENLLKPAAATQNVSPMSRPLGTGICDSAANRAGAEGLVFALDALSVVFDGSLTGPSTGIDVTSASGDGAWREVLRLIYAGMGPSGSNVFTRDCNSAARRALVSNWDDIFEGSTGTTCSDSHPSVAGAGASGYDQSNTIVEPGLRHAFRRDEESGTTDVFLSNLGLPSINFMQTGPSSSVIPAGSTTLQTAVYRALANSPFCNIRRPDDDHPPVSRSGSVIPPMYNVGVPAAAGTGLGLVPYDPVLGDNPRFMAPYHVEMQDQDPIRRRCIGRPVPIASAPNLPLEQVCSVDGNLGLVLPINPPPALTTPERYPSIACDDTLPFAFGPAATRPTGDPVRCPNGDAPQDGQCLLPVRADATQPGGVAFDCLNNAQNVPAALFDTDGNGSQFPDAPTTDGVGNADGRAYNLILRAANGSVRTINRPNPAALGTQALPIVGAFYRLHSTRSGLVPPNHTRVCADDDDATDQIGCLVQLNPCSMGFAGGGAVSNNPGTVAAPVNNIAPTTANVQALVLGGSTYPLARKLYLNSLLGFENIPDTGVDPGKDAEVEMARCFSSVPFNGTFNVASSAFGFVPLPGGTGPAAALCEDFNTTVCATGPTPNVNGCATNPTGIPISDCTNGLRDGIETGPDVCPTGLTCNATTKQCQ